MTIPLKMLSVITASGGKGGVGVHICLSNETIIIFVRMLMQTVHLCDLTHFLVCITHCKAKSMWTHLHIYFCVLLVFSYNYISDNTVPPTL